MAKQTKDAKEISAKRKQEMKSMFEDTENCFGKMYDGKESECKKCKDGTDCKSYKPEGATTETQGTEEKAETTKKDAKKSTPAKKDTKKTAAKKTAAKPKSSREVDEYGYTVGSKNSKIFAMIVKGGVTKAEIVTKMDEQYAGANNKTTVSVFISDVQKPIGKYSTSRGVKLVEDKEGKLSISATELKKAVRTKK